MCYKSAHIPGRRRFQDIICCAFDSKFPAINRDIPISRDNPINRDTPINRDNPINRDIPIDRDIPINTGSPVLKFNKILSGVSGDAAAPAGALYPGRLQEPGAPKGKSEVLFNGTCSCRGLRAQLKGMLQGPAPTKPK